MIKCAVLIHGSQLSNEKCDIPVSVRALAEGADPQLFSDPEILPGSTLPPAPAALPAPEKETGSIYARATLAWLWRMTYGTPCPAIYKDAGGKPHFCDSRVSLSLSHSGAASVAAISDGGETGVDVQCVRQLPRLRRDAAFRRFFRMTPDEILSAAAYGAQSGAGRAVGHAAEIIFIGTESLLSAGTAGAADIKNAPPVKRLPPPPGEERYLAAFSVAEAVMKADGAGLCDGKRLPEIIKKCHSVYDFYEIFGARYFLSVAHIPEK